jgi:cytochrome c
VDGFELNKVAAAILISLLVAMVSSLIGEGLVHPKKPETMAFLVPVEETSSPASEEKALVNITPLLATADVANGEKVFKKCISCHTIGKGEPAKTGPNLWGIVGAAIGHVTDYVYSAALKDKKGNTWTFENLNHFLYKPREFSPGTKMTFIGIADDKERADLLAYLRMQADSPAPLS